MPDDIGSGGRDPASSSSDAPGFTWGSAPPADPDAPGFTWGSAPPADPDAPGFTWGSGRADPVDAASHTDRLAVASIVCSIAGFVTGVTAIAGIVLGLVARHRITRSHGPTKGLRMALAGILLGLASTTWAVVVLEVAIRAADDAPSNLGVSELMPRSAYPEGWKAQGSGTQNVGANYFTSWFTPAQVRQLATCLHMSAASVQTNPAEAAAQEYDSPTEPISANETVDVFSNTAAAAVDAIAPGESNAVSCQFQVASEVCASRGIRTKVSPQ